MNGTSQPSPLTLLDRETVEQTQSTSQDCPTTSGPKLDVVFLFPTGQQIAVERVSVDFRTMFWFHWLRSMPRHIPSPLRRFHEGQARACLRRLEASGYPLWTIEAEANSAKLGLAYFNLRKKQ